MMQMLLVGIWACAVTAGATYGGFYWRQHERAPEVEHGKKLAVRKVKPITVPIIADGALKGYVSAEFNFLGMQDDGDAHGMDLESFFLDEAFRLIYGEAKIDFAKSRKADIVELTSRLTANINLRLGRPVVKETLVKNFTFVPREDMPH